MIPFVLLQDSRRSQIRHRMSHSFSLVWRPGSQNQLFRSRHQLFWVLLPLPDPVSPLVDVECSAYYSITRVAV